jgi:hypothetical protein
VQNADITVVAERPRIGPHRAEIRATLVSSASKARRTKEWAGSAGRRAWPAWPSRCSRPRASRSTVGPA